MAGALVLTLVIAYVLTRTMTSPINALIVRTEEIARGGKSAIVPLENHGTREIATLGQSFLDLAEKLVDRTDYISSFAAHVTHEFKSPLTAIRGSAELLREDHPDMPMTDDQRRHFLDNIVADAERLDRLLSRLRELARAELPTSKGETTVADVASHLTARFPRLEVTTRGSTDLVIALPPEAAGIVFANLADNAIQHGATRLDIMASASEGLAILVISDNGSGISDGNRDLIFQPFFSTRREQGGTGMGLDIVRAMLSTHGGTIRLVDDRSNGTTFSIAVPARA